VRTALKSWNGKSVYNSKLKGGRNSIAAFQARRNNSSGLVVLLVASCLFELADQVTRHKRNACLVNADER